MPSGFRPDLLPEAMAEAEPHLSVCQLPPGLSHPRTTFHTASGSSPSILCGGGCLPAQGQGAWISGAEAQASGVGIARCWSGKRVSLGQRKKIKDIWLSLKREAKRDRNSGGGQFISKAVFRGGGVTLELPCFPGLGGATWR